MKLLDELEVRIDSLHKRAENLEQNNAYLRTELEQTRADLEDRGLRLAEIMEKTKQRKGEILGRIDMLLHRLSDENP